MDFQVNEVFPRIHHITEFPELKFDHLLDILKEIYHTNGNLEKIVILTSSDNTANIIADFLNRYNVQVTTYSGSRKPKRKRRAVYGFNTGRFQILVVSQSGLDAETGEIFHFINFDMTLPYPLNQRSTRNKNRRQG
ncbi:hypothetical protein PVAND_014474 [Polypedilum vanderplanki]|uniref:Helicase C-terminal domain-containing protein n=1 Tax=Polypedilum vanderplanki TaxID=319348 RepID=A0A9J6BA02_POLVA|nr:hypothetical protein PVAND_014474 [Polypedilum vanderplanki]